MMKMMMEMAKVWLVMIGWGAYELTPPQLAARYPGQEFAFIQPPSHEMPRNLMQHHFQQN